MPNIYLKVTVEKNWRSQNFDFLGSNNLLPGQCLGSSNSHRHHWILKLLVATYHRSWSNTMCWFFYNFNFERNYDVLKLKSPCILLNKNINFNKNETKSKWKISHTVLERRTLSFSSNENFKLKLKVWWDGAHKRKKRAFFVPFILSKGYFFNVCVFYLNV